MSHHLLDQANWMNGIKSIKSKDRLIVQTI